MKKITISVLFEIGQLVYLKTDVQQLPRLVVGYIIRPTNNIVYELQHGHDAITMHYVFEISDDVNVLLSSTN